MNGDHVDWSAADQRDYGELEVEGGRTVVRFTRRLRHPPQAVWRALSEPEGLEAWFPTTIEGERKAGAPLHFGFRDMEAPPFDGRMLVFDPPTVMELQWGEDKLRFEMQPDDAGTVLVLTVVFGQIGKVSRDSAGWHACLDRLGCALDGRPAPSSADRWRQVRATYIERFGPEASAIGPPEEWERAHGSDTGPAT
jgi:uncharacterized protein YndB with AHSA1/START domain